MGLNALVPCLFTHLPDLAAGEGNCLPRIAARNSGLYHCFGHCRNVYDAKIPIGYNNGWVIYLTVLLVALTVGILAKFKGSKEV